jgi:hypothetical protein
MKFRCLHGMGTNEKVVSIRFPFVSSSRLTRWADVEDADRFVVRLLCTMDLEGRFADKLDLQQPLFAMLSGITMYTTLLRETSPARQHRVILPYFPRANPLMVQVLPSFPQPAKRPRLSASTNQAPPIASPQALQI